MNSAQLRHAGPSEEWLCIQLPRWPLNLEGKNLQAVPHDSQECSESVSATYCISSLGRVCCYWYVVCAVTWVSNSCPE